MPNTVWNSGGSTDANNAGNWDAGLSPAFTLQLSSSSAVDCIFTNNLAAAGLLLDSSFSGTFGLATYTLDLTGDAIISAGPTVTASAGARLEIGGNLTLASGATTLPPNLTVSMDGVTKTITSNGVSGSKLEVDSAGVIAVADASSWVSIDVVAGTFDLATFAMSSGDLTLSGTGVLDVGTAPVSLSGTFDGGGLTVTGDGSTYAIWTGSGTIQNVAMSNIGIDASTGSLINGLGNSQYVVFDMFDNPVLRRSIDSTRPQRFGVIPKRRR